MGSKSNLTQGEKEKIVRFRKKGLTINQISALTGRSKAAVAEASYGVVGPHLHWYKGERRHIYMLLIKIWHWKPPEEQPVLFVSSKRRKPTNFRTPYSYPRLWDEERKSYDNR